jgi:hypothetical protein
MVATGDPERSGEDIMDLLRTELIVATLIAERQREARQQDLVDAFAQVSPVVALAGRMGRFLMRLGNRLESIECDRLRVPVHYAVGAGASD